jgi:hypothetical protein
MKSLRNLIKGILILIIGLSGADLTASAQAAAMGCASNLALSRTYVMMICFTNPSSGSILTGDVPISVTVNPAGSAPRVRRMVFSLNSTYLLTDYSSPYSFTLPSNKWPNGTYTIYASALMSDGYKTTDLAQVTVKFQNGLTAGVTNSGTFSPSSGRTPTNGSPFLVAATGDGASGEANATKVATLVNSFNPNLFLYLGDVYESGSIAEFYNWYGTSSSNFSALKAITDPTIGNHEYNDGVGGAGYFDYWSNIPNYYSFDAGGWHFISLNSNGSKVGGLGSGSPEYLWLQQDLAANAGSCTIVFYHHPLFNIGTEGPTSNLADMWALMAQSKVTIVLNGHDHDYQRWMPLDGTGQPSSSGITEFVAGGGGHGLQDFVKTDSRVAYSNMLNPTAFGVLLLQLSQSGATFTYNSINGSVLDSGFISCKTTP